MMRLLKVKWCLIGLRYYIGRFAVLGLFITSLSVPAHAAADAARGAIIVRVRCSACHFIHRAEYRLGPNLFGIYDRAPSITGVPFKRWNAKALNAWLSGPRKIKKNTLMIFPPLPAQDRADVIAYFKQQKQRLIASSASPGAP